MVVAACPDIGPFYVAMLVQVHACNFCPRVPTRVALAGLVCACQFS